MARNDDEDDDDFESEDRPRKKSKSRADDEDDDPEDADRPRKKSKSHEDDESDRPSAGKKPLPARLMAAAIASMGWGTLELFSHCSNSMGAFVFLIESWMRRRDRPGVDLNFVILGESTGMLWMVALVYFFLFLFSALLLIGGASLLLRKGFGKYLALGAPIGLVLVALIGFAVGMILSRGNYVSTLYNALLLNLVFSLAVGVANFVLLLNKSVSKALR